MQNVRTGLIVPTCVSLKFDTQSETSVKLAKKATWNWESETTSEQHGFSFDIQDLKGFIVPSRRDKSKFKEHINMQSILKKRESAHMTNVHLFSLF